MKLEDIIALAKAGYKPSDIKELVKLAEEPKEPKEPKEPTTVEMKTMSVDLKRPSTTAPDKKESIYTSKV